MAFPAVAPRSVRRPRPRVRHGAGALVGALALTALAGCGGSDDGGSSASATPSSPATSSSAQPSQDTAPATPSESTTESAPASPSPSPSPSAPASTAAAGGPVAALLDASALPGPSAGSGWQVASTGEAGQDAFGTCQRFDLPTVGASRAVQRTFASTGTGSGPQTTAAQQVVLFPDFSTTRRVTRVLTSWHNTCAAQVRATTSGATAIRVAPQTSVPLGAGSGSWYLVRWQPAGGAPARYEAFGLAVVGKRMALLRMDGTGRAFPAGGAPMVSAVKAAGARLAG